MQDFLTWGAVIAAGSSLVAITKFWMDLGAYKVKAEMGENAAKELADFKVNAAQTYATIFSVSEVEKGLADAVTGVYGRLDAMNSRLDRVLEALMKP